jgi:NAD(P)-dependent dehydrogenase (short-subunit alcohol dehydrogenase family)
VTGGYAGMGLQITKALLSTGATVVLPVRHREKPGMRWSFAGCWLALLDLMDRASIDGFADRFFGLRRTLPILMNNAGIVGNRCWMTIRWQVRTTAKRPGNFLII